MTVRDPYQSSPSVQQQENSSLSSQEDGPFTAPSSSFSNDNSSTDNNAGTRQFHSDSLSIEFPSEPTQRKTQQSKIWWRTGRASAFVTFLKALFGVSLLSSPRVFNETGLLLGTIAYVVIILACAFACYLLLQARSVVLEQSRMEQPAPRHHHVITYGELGRKLLGAKASVIITFLIVTLHLLFGSGMVAGAMHEVLAAQGNEDQEGFSPLSRAVLALCLFPVISLLLQFRNLADLVKICAAGLIVYIIGCVLPMFYVAAIKSLFSEEDEDGNGGPDAPNDIWEWKFRGIPRFVGSTICAIEGINLALPTANSLHSKKPQAAVPVVSAVVFSYGLFTLTIAWIGYLGGLGGGVGTKHGEDSCHDISYCLDSELIGRIHQLSLSAALLLTLPIILFPSIEMLEIWTDERMHQLETGRTSSNRTITEGWNGFVYGSESFRNYSLMMKDFEASMHHLNAADDTPPHPSMNRHWKLRVAHATAVCVCGAMERSFKPFFTLLSGIGISIAGFVLPCILYGLATEHVSRVMRIAMAGLTGLGLCNIVLVFISVFTSHDFVSRRGEHHHHD